MGFRAKICLWGKLQCRENVARCKWNKTHPQQHDFAFFFELLFPFLFHAWWLEIWPLWSHSTLPLTVCVREIERQIRQKDNSREKRTEKLWPFLKKRQILKPNICHFFARQADQRSSINFSLPPPPPRPHRKLCLQAHVFAQNEYSPEFEHSKKILFHGRETPFWLLNELFFSVAHMRENVCCPRWYMWMRRSFLGNCWCLDYCVAVADFCRFFTRICDVCGLEMLLIIITSIG